MPCRFRSHSAIAARFAVCLLTVLTWSSARADQAPIVIDGAMGDWDGVPVAYTDTPNGGAVDFGQLWIADDERFLFLRVEVGDEVDLSENNSIRVYLDTDNNAGTGIPIGGIGAELEWRCGDRTGFFEGSQVFHEDIRFRSGPTVTATEFEMAFGRDTSPNGQAPLFQGPTVRIVMRDLAGGDLLPDAGQFITYTFDQGTPPVDDAIQLAREQAGDLRLATFNVLNDSPWDPGDEPKFERLVTAAHPDIICFQEVGDHSASEAAQLVSSWLPGNWTAVSTTDCTTVTHLPILGSWDVGNENAALIDATSVLGSEILVINAHLPCCDNDSGRQNAADGIAAFIRDARLPGGPLTLDPDTPIIVTGDMNLVGLAQQLDTLLEGDIVNNGSFGPDFAPDWDGSGLLDVIAQQTEKRMGYTWRNDNSSFWPGRLDFIMASDSVLEVGNRFLLYTPEMSAAELAANGLQSGDSLASDHLLFCADFRAPVEAGCPDLDGNEVVDTIDFLALLAAWGPNPGHPADLDGNGTVDTVDFLMLLAAWGPC